MPDQSPEMQRASELRLQALSRWDDEGGAGPHGAQKPTLDAELGKVPPLGNAELVQLQIRVIALENLVITLLAEGADRQLDLAREMATYISPRPGFTQHPLTVRAASHIVDLVNRAIRYRSVDTGTTPATPVR